MIFCYCYSNAFYTFINLCYLCYILFLGLGFLSLGFGFGNTFGLIPYNHGTPFNLNNFLIYAWYRLLIASYYKGFPGITRANAFYTFFTQNKRVQVIIYFNILYKKNNIKWSL